MTVAVYDAINVLNAFLFPLITQSPERRVLPLALWTFQGHAGLTAGFSE